LPVITLETTAPVLMTKVRRVFIDESLSDWILTNRRIRQVGQDGILRGGWQPPPGRLPIGPQVAFGQPAPQSNLEQLFPNGR
jgi:hypothetical protein